MSRGQQASKAHILLVEDNPGDVQLLRLAFDAASLDCDLTVIADGAEAVQLVRQFESDSTRRPPDLAILDLNVPRKDGLEVLESIRASSPLAAMPVVILTSSSSPRELNRLQTLGACRHITKPAELEAFMAIGPVIKQILEKRQSA
jgi:two-component system response regulator